MKLLKLADRTVSVLGILLFGILTGLSLFSTIYYSTQYNEPPRQISDLFFVVLVVCATFLFFMYRASEWIRRRENPEKWIRILLAFVLSYTLCFCVLWVIGAGCIPVGDQLSVCRAAEGFRNGDFSMLTKDSYEKYLFIHPHQLGLTALIELIFAVFGNGNFQAFEFLNCLGAVLCVYSGYRIVRLMAEEQRARIYYLFLAAGCFPLFFYVTYVYGEIPSLAYSLAAAWMFLEYRKRRKVWGLLLCAFFGSLACLIRSNSMILLIAFLCVLLVSGLGKRRWRAFAAAAFLVLALMASRFALHGVYERRAGITLNEGAPMILYVAMGMQEGDGAPGWSNGYILHAYWGASDFDGEKASAMAVEDIKTSLGKFRADPLYAGWFFREKFVSQWNDPSYECFTMTVTNGWPRIGVVNSMYVGKLNALMIWFMNQYQSLIFGGVFLWLLYGFFREKELEDHLLLIFILGGFFFHTVWEAKGRYILPYFVAMLPMAAIGLSERSARAAALLRKYRGPEGIR